MAKKTRVPPPPRVQAPQRRFDKREPNRDWRALLLAGAGAVALLAIVGATFAFGVVGGGEGGPGGALREAGCTFRTFPDQGANHIDSPSQTLRYNSDPPTSGTHLSQPAVWGAYDEPVEKQALIHNLEHGGVAIRYGNRVAADEVASINSFYSNDPQGLIVAALPKLGDKIALTAWTKLAVCPSYDSNAFDAFVDAFRFKGPERLPPDALQPGS